MFDKLNYLKRFAGDIGTGFKEKPVNFCCRVATAIYAVILFYFNFIRVFDNHVWLDEAYTGTLTRMSVMDMIHTTANDVHPPLYYLFTQAFCKIFGIRTGCLHFVSIVPLAILFVFAIVVIWDEFGPEASVIFITMLGLSDLAVRYNVEIRMYSWASLFVFFAFYAFYCIIRFGRIRDYIWFSLFSLAAAYTHYYALIAVAFFYVALFIHSIVRNRAAIKKDIIITVIAVVAYLPWLGILLQSMKVRINNYWITDGQVPTVRNCFEFIFSEHFPGWMWRLSILMLILTVLYESGFLIIEKINAKEFILKIRQKIHYSDLLVLIAVGFFSFIGTALVGIIVSKEISPFFVVRYMYVLALVIWLILGILFHKMKLRILWCSLFTVWVLTVLIPAYKAISAWDLINFQRTMITVNAVNEIPSEDTIILNYELQEFVPSYYFYDRNLMFVTYDVNDLTVPDLDDEQNYWLLIQDEWDMSGVYDQLQQQGYSCELVSEGGILGYSNIYIYQLLKK